MAKNAKKANLPMCEVCDDYREFLKYVSTPSYAEMLDPSRLSWKKEVA